MVNNYDGTNSLTYDANGNMTGDGVNSYTCYATASEQERAIEVVTSTLWNNGYIAVSGFESGAGGRTAALGETATDSYEGGTFILTNVRDINVRGQTLEQWVIENVILRNP